MNDCALHASIGLNMTKYSKLNLSIRVVSCVLGL